MPTERTLNISFDYAADTWWEYAVDKMAANRLFVRILPDKGRPPFDAYIVGIDDEAGTSGAIKYMEGTPESGPTGDVKTIVADKIHVY